MNRAGFEFLQEPVDTRERVIDVVPQLFDALFDKTKPYFASDPGISLPVKVKKTTITSGVTIDEVGKRQILILNPTLQFRHIIDTKTLFAVQTTLNSLPDYQGSNGVFYTFILEGIFGKESEFGNFNRIVVSQQNRNAKDVKIGAVDPTKAYDIETLFFAESPSGISYPVLSNRNLDNSVRGVFGGAIYDLVSSRILDYKEYDTVDAHESIKRAEQTAYSFVGI